MFSHIMIGTNDVDRAKGFYDALLATLGASPGFVDGHRVFYMHDGGVLGVTKPIDGEPANHANAGLREGNLGKMYLAYLRDPDGNKLCAFHRVG